MIYTVRMTPATEALILAQARYIAVDQQAPMNAAKWLDRVFDAADTLEQWPRRCSKAEEDEYRPYEIRKLNVSNSLLLFTIVDETQTVWVVHFRHTKQQPRPGDLPEDVPTEDGSNG